MPTYKETNLKKTNLDEVVGIIYRALLRSGETAITIKEVDGFIEYSRFEGEGLSYDYSGDYIIMNKYEFERELRENFSISEDLEIF